MQYNSNNIRFAKEMRSHMTKEEVKLWNILRAKRFHGYKFKRQVLIGNYIADFVCEEKKIIIEIDGGQHNHTDIIEYDIERTNYLKTCGYDVLRFWNGDVWLNIESVCDVIYRKLEE